MSASLVGSEMCIRDSPGTANDRRLTPRPTVSSGFQQFPAASSTHPAAAQPLSQHVRASLGMVEFMMVVMMMIMLMAALVVLM
eukprot:2974773-Alexandrium_andersonii.AAC.1